jgi:hypothetical protein
MIAIFGHPNAGTPSARVGERLVTAPLIIEPMSTIAFSRGAHVFAAHP